MKRFVKIALLVMLTVGIFYFPGVSTVEVSAQKAAEVDVRNLTGTWVGYYDDGTKSPYVWSIRQTGATLAIADAKKGGTTKSRGTIDGSLVRALDFATQDGKLSADGTKIVWSDGVVWVKDSPPPNLNGVWVGYYEDGTKSPYLWNVGHTGSNIWIDDAKNPGTSKSKGTINGNKIVALDFATKNGTLSADGKRITWSDGVVWVKE